MIVITNISRGAPIQGVNKYELKINEKVICSFKHDRQPDGLAQCLRDAAKAVENNQAMVVDVTELSDMFGLK